jgi:2-hydroxy-6-oxonona-2,4-dienedioate hydrolase
MNRFVFPVFLAMASVALQAQPAIDKQIDVFGQKIHYVEAGTGPAVILLHGLGGDVTNWGQNIPALAPKYHVFAIDQIGFGKSDKPTINFRIETLVEFLDAFCRKLEISKAAVVGNSLGGWAAMAFTLAHPEKVSRLVLVDSAGYSMEKQGRKASREEMLALNPSTLLQAKLVLNMILANKQMITDGLAQQFFAQHLSRNDGYTINAFIDSILRDEDVVDGRLGAIKVPTLIVWGREDLLVPLNNGSMLAQDIAGSEMVVMDHCGHVPMLECAQPFNAALLKFLAADGTQSSK